MTTSVTSGLTAEQLEARKTGIGGSDAAAVIGVNPYRTALEVYELKLGLRPPDPANAQMRRGIYLEPIARKLYKEITSRPIRSLKQVRHPSHHWMLCNVDGMILGGKRGVGVLELKCPGIWVFAKAKREGLPLHWIVQMQHNLCVTGYKWGSFALFNADLWEMIHFDVERDEDLINALIQKEEQFWKGYVEPRVPPPVVENTAPELLAQLAKAQGDAGGGDLIVRNDPQWADAAAMYREAKEIAETGENLLETAKAKLKELMGGYGAIEGAGLRAYFSQRAGRVTFDKKALAAGMPMDRTSVATAVNEFVQAIPGDLIEGFAQANHRLIEALDAATLDLSAFDKTGKPYDQFAAYIVKAGVGD